MSNVQQDEKAVNPASPEFFFEAEAAYKEATQDRLELVKKRFYLDESRQQERDGLKDVEARLIANGQVEGKNAEERTARLRLLLADDPEAQALRGKAALRDEQMIQLEGEITRREMRQKVALYRLRYADATLRYLANIPPESPHESEAE